MAGGQVDVQLVLGAIGAGKSHLIEHMMLPSCPGPVWVLDSEHEYFEDNPRAVHYYGRSHPSRNPTREMLQLLREGKTTQFRYHVCRPSWADADLHRAQCLDFIRALVRGRISGTIVVDETDKYSNARKAEKPIRDLLMRGRKFGQHQVYACRRAVNISTNIFSQTTAIISFYQDIEADIKRLENKLENAHQLPQLGEYEFVVGGRKPDRLPYLDTFREATHPETGQPLWTGTESSK